jgi:hypothetical protein
MNARTSGNINFISSLNSSSTPLNISSTFTGTGEDIHIYKSLIVSLFSDKSSATNGLSLEFSIDGTNYDFKKTYSIIGNSPFSTSLQVIARYFRVVYTNGITAQSTFRMQTIYVSSQNSDEPTTISASSIPKSINTKIIDPLDSFGDLSITEKNPSNIISFRYNINTNFITTSNTGSSTITQLNSMARLRTGTTINSTSLIRSISMTSYTPGIGVRCYITPVFNNGISGTTQYAGIGNTDCGYFFGYNGTTFGIIYRNNSIDTFIPQSTWNNDKMDGSGKSGMILDPTKGNVYMIKLQWLGFGFISFFIENQYYNDFILVHTINYPNSFTTPSLQNPGFYCLSYISNGATTNDMSLYLSCIAVYTEGSFHLRPGYRFSSNNLATIASSTLQTILTLRNKTTYSSKTNYSPLSIDIINFSTSGNKPVRFDLIRNPTTVGVLTYNDVSSNSSIAEFSTTVSTVTAGYTLLSFSLNQNNNLSYDLSEYMIDLSPNEVITIAGYTTSATNENTVCCSWKEFQ